MAYLTTSELSTHLNAEIVQEIERSDSDVTKLKTAITAAIEEAGSYLSAFDKQAIFAATGDDRNPILLLYVKDIAIWHYVQLANPNIEIELRKERFEKAIKWLEKVQAGNANPSLPLLTADTTPQGESFVKFGSNPKRINNY